MRSQQCGWNTDRMLILGKDGIIRVNKKANGTTLFVPKYGDLENIVRVSFDGRSGMALDHKGETLALTLYSLGRTTLRMG